MSVKERIEPPGDRETKLGGIPLDAFVRRHFVPLALLLLALLLATRFYHLGYDPPSWTSPDYLTDEGWWADSARGKIFFDNYFSDDFGTSYLMTPAYTFALEGVYDLFGVGTVQTRAVAATAEVLTVVVVFLLALRLFGPVEALIAGLLLTASPFAWSFGWVGLIEWSQALFIAVAFALWVERKRRLLSGLLAGLAMAVAMWMKPNAVGAGLLPVLVAAIAMMVVESRAARVSGSAPPTGRSIGRLALAAAGFVAGCGAVAIWIVLPNLHQFLRLAFSESGASSVHLFEFLDIPGAAFMDDVFVSPALSLPGLWSMGAWSPALVLGMWCYLLWHLGRHGPQELDTELLAGRAPSGGRVQTKRGGLQAVETGLAAWFLATLAFAVIEIHQPPRRFVVVLAPLVLCIGVQLARLLRGGLLSAHGATGSEGTHHIVPTYWRSCLIWLVLLFPIMVAMKPAASRAIMHLGAHWHLGVHRGLSDLGAASLFTLVWLTVTALLATLRVGGERFRRTLAALAPVIVGAALLFEIPFLIATVATAKPTFLSMQRELAPYADSAKVIMGHPTTSLFMPYRVRTVRRSLPIDHSPPPNPEIWSETHPRYIVEMTRYDYFPQPPKYADLRSEHHYFFVKRFGIGPARNGIDRFAFKIYEMPNGGSNAADARAATGPRAKE